jgi:hypothetical protein
MNLVRHIQSPDGRDTLDAQRESVVQLSTRIWRLFHDGKDTNDIAKSLAMPEARVSRLLWAARCREKRRPATFIDSHGRTKVIAQ